MVVIVMGCSKKKERVYELLPPDPEMDKDLTELAIKMSVNIENRDGADAGEGSKKVIDGNIDSKFLILFLRSGFFTSSWNTTSRKGWMLTRLPRQRLRRAAIQKTGRSLAPMTVRNWTELDFTNGPGVSGKEADPPFRV